MSNPRSLAWGIEIWGWGFFGVASWLLSSVFARAGLERATAAFAAWNVLLTAMAALAWVALRRRLACGAGESIPSATAAGARVADERQLA